MKPSFNQYASLPGWLVLSVVTSLAALLHPAAQAQEATPAQSLKGLEAQVGVTADAIQAARHSLDNIAPQAIDLGEYPVWMKRFRADVQTALDEFQSTIQTEIYAKIGPAYAAYNAVAQSEAFDQGQKEALINERLPSIGSLAASLKVVYRRALEKLYNVDQPFPAEIRVEQLRATNWSTLGMGDFVCNVEIQYQEGSGGTAFIGKKGKYRVHFRDLDKRNLGSYDLSACGTPKGIFGGKEVIKSEEELYDIGWDTVSARWQPFSWTTPLPEVPPVLFQHFLAKDCGDHLDCQALKGETMTRWWATVDQLLAQNIEVSFAAGTPFAYTVSISSGLPIKETAADPYARKAAPSIHWFRSLM